MGEMRISRLNYERARLGLPLINIDELNLLAIQWKTWVMNQDNLDNLVTSSTDESE